jgi:UDP-2-acetamido-3-amino-2,3-dideoxy-glucuronate N-acetyltransferase
MVDSTDWLAGEFGHHHAESASIDERALVENPSHVGERCTILPFARVMGYVRLGNNCWVGHHSTMASGVIAGENVKVLDYSLITAGTILGNEVNCGPFAVFSNPKRVRANHAVVSRISPTLVRDLATISSHVVIANGVSLGRACFIEPHSIVDRSIPDYAVMSGNPITFKNWRCECGYPLSFESKTGATPLTETECGQCGERYRQVSEYSIQKRHTPNAPLNEWCHLA